MRFPVPAPAGTASIARVNIPAAAANNATFLVRHVYGIIAVVLTVGIFCIHILTPLAEITAHVINAESIG
jgi:hypothetical protein